MHKKITFRSTRPLMNADMRVPLHCNTISPCFSPTGITRTCGKEKIGTSCIPAFAPDLLSNILGFYLAHGVASNQLPLRRFPAWRTTSQF
ncbi:hypothetical protein PAXRUDRAFT_354381 [Paxillus rubicundulus Ve08.2h10]|uniref:Uncharacterized protein n=1 Tax=Paxillus rubicundulus Ve08.2h10 TaxID=930991 RepID=A0A0D0DZA8_9AGAM|nr:hypothetical protein PAXRUDRAFT_354381 [Paxillus rubicundulus Ve08.2h10]